MNPQYIDTRLLKEIMEEKYNKVSDFKVEIKKERYICKYNLDYLYKGECIKIPQIQEFTHTDIVEYMLREILTKMVNN